MSTDTLSYAERSTATFAAQGLTNPQIARRLHITVSTVEQHLTRVYRKTGATRAGLAAALTAVSSVTKGDGTDA